MKTNDIFDEINKDFQAHTLAWKAVLHGDSSISEEEKKLLKNRVDPILREMQISLNTVLNSIEEIINEFAGDKKSIKLEGNLANRMVMVIIMHLAEQRIRSLTSFG